MREKSELECNCMFTPPPCRVYVWVRKCIPFPSVTQQLVDVGLRVLNSLAQLKASWGVSWLRPVVCVKLSYFAQLRFLPTADDFHQQFLLTIMHPYAKVSFLETLASVLTVTSQADCRTLTLSHIVLLLRCPIRNLGRSFNNPCNC